MKKYVSPDVTMIFFSCQDICRTSDWVGGDDTYKSQDYGFGETWL